MKLVLKLVVFASILGCSTISAQEFVELSGSLPDLLTAEKPYLVVGDIFVSPGSSVSIEAGAVLLFESFTGLHIQGSAYVKGEPGKSVVFTSKNDKQWNPGATVSAAPFDWNGIDVYETGVGTNFSHCMISFSVYGIRSQTEHLKIVNSVFRSNGKADMTVNGERQNVNADEPFTFGLSPAANQIQLPQPQELAQVSVNKDDPIAVPEQTNKKAKTRVGMQILRYSSLALGIGSGIAAAWYYSMRYDQAQQKLEDLSELDKSERLNYSSKDWEAAEDDRNRKLGICIAGASGALIGVGFFAVSFAF